MSFSPEAQPILPSFGGAELRQPSGGWLTRREAKPRGWQDRQQIGNGDRCGPSLREAGFKTMTPRQDVLTFNKWFAAGFKVRLPRTSSRSSSLDGSTGLKSICLACDRSRKAYPRSNWRNSDGVYSRYSQSSPPSLRSNLPWIDLNRSPTAAIRCMATMTSAFSAA